MNVPKIVRWQSDNPPTENTVYSLLEQEGLRPYRWSNNPGDVYQAHSHSYHKVIVVVHGFITFRLPDVGQEIYLQAGDRLELPAEVVHSAKIGQEGVVCLEAHRERW